MLKTLTQIGDWLKEHELKVTHQRLVIGQCLMGRNDHPTAEELHTAIQHENPSLGLATVYKTLDAFVKAGMVRKVVTNEGVARYDANLTPHDHLYCQKTHRIMDIKLSGLHDAIKQQLEDLQIDNFAISDFQVQIKGELIDEQKPVRITNQK